MAAWFRLPNDTRLYVKGSSGEEKIGIHIGKKVKLEQFDDTAGRILPRLYASSTSVALSGVTPAGRQQTFLVEAKSPGRAVLGGRDRTGKDAVAPLTVVTGSFASHPGMAPDLLAERLGRSSDGARIHALQRLLNNNPDNPINQLSSAAARRFGQGTLACGSVCEAGATAMFGGVSTVYNSYHRPLRAAKHRSDVQYDPATLSWARTKIRNLLAKGTPVRVGCTYHPVTQALGGNGALQPTLEGGHFVLIVGCNSAADRFLYLDPWPGGSVLQYKGGISGDPFGERCQHLGLFMVSKGPRLVIRQDPATQGSFSGDSYLEITAGP